MSKVLFIGFGIEPFAKGGAVIYQNSLMEGLRNKGWSVTAFFAAPRYTINNRLFLKTWYKEGIKFIELYNSPCKVGYQNNPLVQCHSSRIESMLKKILVEERPDIVHIHELQLHPASLISIVADAGIASIKTIHNYYDICPQRDLFYKGKTLCHFFPSLGHCAECETVKPQLINRFSYLLYRVKQKVKLVIPDALIKKLKKVQTGNKRVRFAYPNEQYIYRRKFFIKELNRLDVIHCSSSRSKEILSMAGTREDKIKVIPLSNQNVAHISPKPLRDNHYPIVFGYAGGPSLHKGYQLLVKAFSKLDQRKSKLIMWRMGANKISTPGLNIEVRNAYKPEEIDRIFKEIDVGIVPSIWEETFGMIGIEFLTAGIPVIGSEIGGITEWLKDKQNGFLIPPGDTDCLAQKMDMFISDPALIAKFQQQIKPWKTFGEHTNEIINLYKETIIEKKTS